MTGPLCFLALFAAADVDTVAVFSCNPLNWFVFIHGVAQMNAQISFGWNL